MTAPLTRDRLRVELYGGEDYRIYNGARLVATVYSLDDLRWLLDRDRMEGTMTEPLTREEVGNG